MCPSSAVYIRRLAISATALALSSGSVFAQQVFNTNVIVDGSLCVGFDCTSGESFGFDTIRLKENNLRINFEDTSTAASFPTNDWTIAANSSANGGQSYLRFEDVTNSREPFTVEANARTNALYVEDSGDIGVGTSTPATDMHIVIGDTPTVRLEQDGSSGFAPQTWDVAGNETSFFIRDASNGSTLPFRVFPGAATSSLVIDDDDDIGIGAGTNPNARLHVSNGGTVQSAPNANDDVIIQDDGPARLVLINTTKSDTATESDVWTFNSNGTLRLSAGSDASEFTLDAAGNVEIGGALTQGSDRRSKTNIIPVNPREILAKVEGLPVAHWTYKSDAEDGIRHIGPMAQDFYAAFGTGRNETGISMLDGTGVALAAIQALSQRVTDLERQLEED